MGSQYIKDVDREVNRRLMNAMDLGKQLTFDDYLDEEISITKPIRLIELFAGYGSQAMALERIGAKFEHHVVCEFDKYAVASYNAVHGTNFTVSDIRDLHGSDLNIVDKDKYTYMLTYSFPCTDLSVAGKMQGMSKGSGTRSGLLWEVERLLNETEELPDILFMENVPQVLSSKNLDDFNQWTAFLNSKGYRNHYKVLNAKDYGIPQNRKRCFMFSFLGDYNYHFPEPIPLQTTVRDFLEPTVDEKYYINTQRAKELIDKLVLDGTIPDRQTDRQTAIDLSECDTRAISIANTIKARDRGISRHRHEENGIVELEED